MVLITLLEGGLFVELSAALLTVSVGFVIAIHPCVQTFPPTEMMGMLLEMGRPMIAFFAAPVARYVRHMTPPMPSIACICEGVK